MRINFKYVISFIVLLAIEILIAVYLNTGFIRHNFGDYLAVILLFSFFRSFLKTNSTYIATVVLLISFFIEFLQYLNIITYLKIENETLKTIIGTTFSMWDLVAYFLGYITIILIEKMFNTSTS